MSSKKKKLLFIYTKIPFKKEEVQEHKKQIADTEFSPENKTVFLITVKVLLNILYGIEI